MPTILERYERLEKFPGGKFVFSHLVGFAAPFFAKIRPRVVDLRSAYCEVSMPDRRGVRNHLGSINAGALCSLAEMTGGLALDSVMPKSLRWIPRSMTVQYLAKARGKITAISEFNPDIITQGDVTIPINVSNSENTKVFTADIIFHISPKPER